MAVEFTGEMPKYREEIYERNRQRRAAQAQAQAAQAPVPGARHVPAQGPQGPRYALATNPAKEQKRRLKRLSRHVPPKRKSLNVRVDDAVFAALTALQDASGQSRAQLVAQIILEAFARLYPSWSQLAQLRAAMPR